MINLMCCFIIFMSYILSASDCSEFVRNQQSTFDDQNCIITTICTESEISEIKAVNRIVYAAVIPYLLLLASKQKEKKRIVPQEYRINIFVHVKHRPQNARCNINAERTRVRNLC